MINIDISNCVEMLIQILNKLEILKCFLIGQSWGSITALRTSVKFPDRFQALELSRIIDAVFLSLEDASKLIEELKVPALAVIGEEDYAGIPPRIETWTVPGGHISSHESVKQIKDAITKIFSLGSKIT